MNKATFLSSKDFISGEMITVSLARGIHSLSGDSLVGFIWQFRIPSKNVGLNFSKPVTYGGGGYGMQCIDMNNDGSPDIVTSSGEILINNGSGMFNKSWVLNDADGWGRVNIGDFNRDGIIDVVYNGTDGLKIGLADGTGNFNISTIPSWFFNYAIADFNNDGYPDIAGINLLYGDNPPYSDTASYCSIAINDGMGNFQDTTIIQIIGGWFRDLTTTDIDNDGDLDILIISQHAIAGDIHGIEGLLIFKNNGQGIFSEVDKYIPGNYFDIYFPEFLCSADFNNDGFNDIAIMADFSGTILLNSQAGLFIDDSAHTRFFWGAEQISPFTCGDIDGDGWIDVVKSGYKFPPEMPVTYYAVVGNCSNVFSNCRSGFSDKLPDVSIYAVSTADLDDDDDLDIVHTGGGVYVSLNKDTITSVKDDFIQPKEFFLYQNYPNPFNPTTKIRYSIKGSGLVSLKVFDVLGKEMQI